MNKLKKKQRLEKRKKKGTSNKKKKEEEEKEDEGKKKQGTSDLEVENSEMGCKTQHEREKQEEPRETKGDTEKLSKILFLGGNRCFLCFLVGAHQPKFAQKRKEKKITCDMLQNTGD